MPKRLNVRSPSLTSHESYSAVIIADLVAEVQQQPEADQRCPKISEDTNENDEKAAEAVASVDRMETGDLQNTRTNGTSISNGVILNALQFGQSDSKEKVEVGNAIPINAVPVQVTEAPQKDAPASFKEEFSQMSVVRKIAFGFSFIPSVMFILCFAVIFPCEKILPCVEEQWSVILTHTEITSQLNVPHSVLFTFQNEIGPAVKSISDLTGETMWERSITSPSQFIECGNLAKTESQSCLLVDDTRRLHAINPSNGKYLWELNSSEGENISRPVVLPDCNGDGVDEIAMAVSKSKIKIIYLGNIITFMDVPGCDSIPSHLMTWKRQNETDLIFVCQKGENEMLMKVPQNKWCVYDKIHSGKIETLTSTKIGILSQAKLLPAAEKLVLWSNDEVTMFNKTGQPQWVSSVFNQTNKSANTIKNRFLLYGRFNKDKPQVVLYSSDIWANFQITMLDPENGNETLSKTIPDVEILEAILIHGEKRDYTLSLKRKQTKSLKNEAVVQINEMSASVINLLTKEEIVMTLNTSSREVEQLSIMELDGNDIQTIQSQSLSYMEGQSWATTFTVVSTESEEEKKHLKVYVLRKLQDSPAENISTLKSISVSNWDMSSTTASHCVWK